MITTQTKTIYTVSTGKECDDLETAVSYELSNKLIDYFSENDPKYAETVDCNNFMQTLIRHRAAITKILDDINSEYYCLLNFED
jgi:Zn-dependent alcohol dehydrogenase